jgi:hypothetical protein
MIKHIPTEKQCVKNRAMLDALNARFNEVRAELHRVGQQEFIRLYETGPRKPAHLIKF